MHSDINSKTKILSAILALGLVSPLNLSAAQKIVRLTVSPKQEIDSNIEKARELLQQGKKVEIILSNGTHYLKKPIVLQKEDSGLTIKGQRKANLSGGKKITDWKQKNKTTWIATLPNTIPFRSLFIDSKRKYRARIPTFGYLKASKDLSPTEQAGSLGYDRLSYEGTNLPQIENEKNVEVIVFHRWVTSRLKIKLIDRTNQIIYFDGHTPGVTPFYEIRKATRYILDNAKTNEPLATDSWYYDEKNSTLEISLKVNPNKHEIRIPQLESLIQIKGAKDIHFENIEFSDSNWVPPGESYIENQAAANLSPSAIVTTDTENITFKNCKFSRTDGYALEFGPGSLRNKVLSSEFFDLSSGAIRIQGNERQPSGDHIVEENLLYSGGRLYPAGVGVLVQKSHKNVIEQNIIHDFYYTGISIGWTWGYDGTLEYDNQILSNHIWNIGLGVMSDLGGIYTLGVLGKTQIRKNLVHNIESDQDHNGWGIYLDEGSRNTIVYKNVVFHTKSGGFHQHYGKNNRIINNIIAFNNFAQIQRTKNEGHQSFDFRKNIVYWNTKDALFRKNWQAPGYKLDRNIYWNPSYPFKFPNPDRTLDKYSELTLSFRQWQKRGNDIHSKIVDPLFVDPTQFDFHLQKDSPAIKMGIEPIELPKSISVKNLHRTTIPEAFKPKVLFK
ncbi:MAG: right-handed parallel beta-helix repeat-containing protein [Bacteriovoracia bacterium]